RGSEPRSATSHRDAGLTERAEIVAVGDVVAVIVAHRLSLWATQWNSALDRHVPISVSLQLEQPMAQALHPGQIVPESAFRYHTRPRAFRHAIVIKVGDSRPAVSARGSLSSARGSLSSWSTRQST